MNYWISIVLLALAPAILASGSKEVVLDPMPPNMSDHASLQRGAKTFMNYCFGCHATRFQRYERVAKDLGIPPDLMKQYLIFDTTAKIGDLMENAMQPNDAKQWFGSAPPDLTLVARVRNPSWLYTYLRSFYVDPKRPWGVNNKVFTDVAMPNVLAPLQGTQIDTCNGATAVRDNLSGDMLCGLEISQQGLQTPAEFDRTVYDLVNFLVYSGEPFQVERKKLGWYVLAFLGILLVFAYLLKREYWKDVH